MEGDDPLTWLLASYGETIHGDEDAPEDQVAIAISQNSCLLEFLLRAVTMAASALSVRPRHACSLTGT